MNTDLIQSIIRAAVNALAGIAIAKGYGDSSTWEAIGGGALALAMLLWSHFHQKAIKTTAVTEEKAAVAANAPKA